MEPGSRPDFPDADKRRGARARTIRRRGCLILLHCALVLAGVSTVGTFGAGLAHMVDRRFTVMTSRDGLPSDFIQTVFHDRAGRLWVGTLRGSALISTAGKFEKIPDLPGKSISFYEDHNGSIWAATDKTFARLRSKPKAVFEREEGPNHDIETLFEDRDGSLWVGASGA